MKNIAQFLIFSSSLFVFFTIPAQSANSCEPDSCDDDHGPKVRFPFRLKNRQPARCGYPGFDLYCNNRNQTILNLPKSGEFIVDYINYRAQAILIDDPGSCFPNRALNFSLSGSPFEATSMTDFLFLNCSGDWMDYASSDDYVPMPCLSEKNHTVLGYSPAAQVPPACRRVANVSVPQWWRFGQSDWWTTDWKEDFVLDWSEPACRKCENRGGVCGFKGDSGLEIGCSKASGKSLPRSAKYAIIIGIGIPGLLCIIGLACYACGLIRAAARRRRWRRPSSELPTATIYDLRPIIRVNSGLDLPTIASYPKTVLGQSRRLPNPSDNTCSICLSEYQSKETLKSIPECNHYFHAGCIDEWLKLNGTCPLCRKSPESASMATSCSSTPFSPSPSSSSSSSSTALDRR